MGTLFSESKQETAFALETEGKKFETKEEVFEVCPEVGNKTIIEIRLSQNSYSEEACHAIAEIISTQTSIEKADLSDMFTGRTKDIVVPSMHVLCAALSPVRLRVLDVSNNAFGAVGVQAVVDLLKQAPDLADLQVNNNGLGSSGATLVAEGIRNLNLRVLGICRNRIENVGAVAIGEALRGMGSLQRLSVFQNGITAQGMISIFGAVGANLEMQYVNVTDNNLKDPAVHEDVKEMGRLFKDALMDTLSTVGTEVRDRAAAATPTSDGPQDVVVDAEVIDDGDPGDEADGGD